MVCHRTPLRGYGTTIPPDRGFRFSARLRTDMHPLFQKALKLLDLPLGLVVNFHNPRLGDRGIARVILAGADAP